MTEKSNLPIKIHLETQITQDDQVESHSFDEDGQLVKMGDNLYIRYMEHVEQQTIAVRFKIDATGRVQLTRGADKDETQLLLYFKEAEQIASVYQTQYGKLPVITSTNQLAWTVNDQPLSGELVVHYQLEISQQVVGDYKLRLIFTA